MNQVCRAIVGNGDFRLAWVELGDLSGERTVRVVARAGSAEDRLDRLQPAWSVVSRGPGRAAQRALAEAAVRVQGSEVRSSAAMPIAVEGRVWGKLHIGCHDADAFGAAEMEAFQTLADDLGLRLGAFRRPAESGSAAGNAVDGYNLSGLFNYLPDGLLIGYRHENYLGANDGVLRMLGYTREEMLTLGSADIIAEELRAHPSENSSLPRTGEWLRRECMLRRKDGSVFAAEVFEGLTRSGAVTALVRDISPRQAAEAARRMEDRRYRQLFEYVREGILITTPQGRVLDINPALCIVLGYSRDELIDEMSTDLLLDSADDAEKLRAVLLSSREFNDEARFRRKDGVVLSVELIIAATPDGNRLAVIRDVTEKKIAEHALLEARTQLVHVARSTMLGEMIATISHEINQPLSAMATNSAAALRWLARSPPALDEVEAALRRVIRDSQRASAVIARTRSFFARGEVGHAEVAVNDAIEEVITLVDAELRAAGVMVKRDLDFHLPSIWGDRIQIQQVVINLVLNALDAMQNVERCTRRLKVTTRAADETGVIVRIEDSGAGIDPHAVDRLFDAFYTTKSHGTGLGLAISRSIVEAHGGRIWPGVGADGGAAFEFTLASRAQVVA
jgi:PAS domain S-box-containing protein